MKRNTLYSVVLGVCLLGLCCCNVLVAAEYQPVALWQMEQITSGKVIDAAAGSTGLSNNLLMDPSATPPAVVSGHFGNALSFNGVAGQNRARSTFFWNGYESLKFDAWVNPARIEDFEDNDQWIFNIWGSMQIRCRGSKFYFDVRDASNANFISISSSGIYESGSWYHVIANVDKYGNMLLQVDDDVVTGETGDGGWYSSFYAQYMYLGASRYNTVNFEGLIDEVSISALEYVDSSYYHDNDRATYAIYRSEEIVQEQVLGETRDVIADDDMGFEGRGYPLVLGKRPDMGYIGMEPSVTDQGSGKFGEALSFDGFDDMAWIERWRGSDYLKFEAWVKPYDFAAADFGSRYPILLELGGRVRVWYRADTIRIVVRKPDNSGYTTEYRLNVPSGMWDHITVEVNPDGTFSLTSLYGKISGTTGMDGWLNSEVTYLVIGNDRSNVSTPGWYFNGLIDDIKISDVKMPCDGLDYPVGDLSQDCQVNIEDLDLFMQSWLLCTTPDNPDCINLN